LARALPRIPLSPGRQLLTKEKKPMKTINKQFRTLMLAVLLLAGLGLSSCSTGTKEGDVSVEKGGPKDKDPTEHNVEAQGQPRTDTSTMENMEKPYQEAEKASDRDGDRVADPPGTKSEQR
jgi:hypothetical protein